ncbi:hypothetical protein D2E25_0267 [Bifidobacterium goeldii]|uniref:Uncharacterized protein n=1 Tax=Bifidobacterium goeldii TaxID=2306975 RepID=A0A430FMM5_9BIFI|nr:hypothetical protein D2E25_0267 [Bifidobacterium goeldii]
MQNVRDVIARSLSPAQNTVIQLKSYVSYALLLCQSKTFFVGITPLQTIYYNSYVVFTLYISKYVCNGVCLGAVRRKTCRGDLQ